jgi:hypothetical protein
MLKLGEQIEILWLQPQRDTSNRQNRSRRSAKPEAF